MAIKQLVAQELCVWTEPWVTFQYPGGSPGYVSVYQVISQVIFSHIAVPISTCILIPACYSYCLRQAVSVHSFVLFYWCVHE